MSPRDAASTGALRQLLQELGVPGEELDEARLVGAIDALRHFTQGYHALLEDIIGDALFEDAGDEPVIVRDIPFVSMCREHLLPFHGHIHLAYLPGKVGVGLPGLARLLGVLTHRLQTPTRLAEEVARAIHGALEARGVVVRIEAREFCPGTSGRIVSNAHLGDFRLPLWRGRLEGLG